MSYIFPKHNEYLPKILEELIATGFQFGPGTKI